MGSDSHKNGVRLHFSAAQTKTISYTGDSISKVTSMTYPSGKDLALSYVQSRTNAMTLNTVPLISGIQYFPFGGPESWLLGSNTSTKEYTRIIDQSSCTQQYDPKVVPLRNTTPNGFRTISYDNASRIVGINNYTGATQAAALANGITASQLFTYDSAGRLTTFSGYTSNGVNAVTGIGNAAMTQTQSFAYDSNGNRTSSILNSVASTYSYQSGNNRLASVTGGIIKTNSFDATGNLTNDGSQTYTYDARGRLTGATVPANAAAPTTNYLINYQGLRVRKTNASAATTATAENRTFIYDDSGKMLGEYDHAGNAVQELIWLGDTPIAVTGTTPCLTSTTGANGTPTCTEAATAYIFTDHLNTPREVARINTTTNAYVSLWKWDSLPFGETQPNQNPSNTGIFSFNHRFPGQYKDKETGLHQNWHRDYDVVVGRYITSDPLGLGGGGNTFSYVFSSPLNGTDKLGLCTVVVVNLNGIGHSGVYVDRGEDGKPFLYDPGGSFGGNTWGSGDAFFGKEADLNAYIKFQQNDNAKDEKGNTIDRVSVFRFDTTRANEKSIAKNGENMGGVMGGFCVPATTAVIKGIGPFKNLSSSTLPSGLAADLGKLVQGCK